MGLQEAFQTTGPPYALGVGAAARVSYVADHAAVYSDVLRMLASLPS